MTRRIPPRLAARKQQVGVGLIEVLIAVLVVSIGFLGVAALQVYSLSTNNSAMARSMATISSYSIIDAMRADRSNAIAGKYNGTVEGGSCPAKGDALWSRQLHEWCAQLEDKLGRADTTKGTVTCADFDAGKGVDFSTKTLICTVTITFDDSRSGGDTAQHITTRVAL
jgi:type IV pilus assembly protein PilV